MVRGGGTHVVVDEFDAQGLLLRIGDAIPFAPRANGCDWTQRLTEPEADQQVGEFGGGVSDNLLRNSNCPPDPGTFSCQPVSSSPSRRRNDTPWCCRSWSAVS